MSTINSLTTSTNAYTALAKSAGVKPSSQPAHAMPSPSVAKSGSTVTISQAARDALAAAERREAEEVERTREQIKAKDPVTRTVVEFSYLVTPDPRMTELLAKKSGASTQAH